MKKILIFVVACAALAACSKEIIDKQSDSPQDAPQQMTSFVKGQKVTLSGGPLKTTKVSSSLNNDQVDFTWEAGDEISVYVKTGESYSNPAKFTLIEGAGSKSAKFTGEMPAAGDTYIIQYPALNSLLSSTDLIEQSYKDNALPEGKMLFKSDECSLDKDFVLHPQYSAIRLNLYGQSNIAKIVVTNTSSTITHTYTLNCPSGGVIPGNQMTAKPFCLVMPVGHYKFKVEIFGCSNNLIRSRELTELKDQNVFTEGKILNMPALGYPMTDLEGIKIGDVTWAPVNCGFNPMACTAGKLYQFGRIAGCKYEASEAAVGYYQKAVISSAFTDGYVKNPQDDCFYYSYADWYAYLDNTTPLPEWPMSAPAGTSGIGNPCPDGWRVPTESELSSLLGGNTTPALVKGQHGNVQLDGFYLNGTSSASSSSDPVVFLPAAGRRDGVDATFGNSDTEGRYWSSTASYDESVSVKTMALNLKLNADYSHMSNNRRANGYSVRCVSK